MKLQPKSPGHKTQKTYQTKNISRTVTSNAEGTDRQTFSKEVNRHFRKKRTSFSRVSERNAREAVRSRSKRER